MLKRLFHRKKKDGAEETPRAHFEHGNFEDYYVMGEFLGKGNFSQVYSCTEKSTNIHYACKRIDITKADPKTEQLIEREIEVLMKIDHPNVVRLHDMFDTPTEKLLVMELVTGGELFDSIVARGRYSESDARDLMKQLLSAIQYLHEVEIVHRDLKPENLLLSDKGNDASLKVADFGLSKFVSTDLMLKTACGTPGYVAPEVLKCQGYSTPVDMWSAGVIMYILLCGFPPFYDDDMTKLFRQILAAKVDFPEQYWKHVSNEAKDLIRHLLVVDPAKRLTAVQALNHPWITGKTLSTDHLPDVITAMRSYNARRRLKGAIHTVMAANKLTTILHELNHH